MSNGIKNLGKTVHAHNYDNPTADMLDTFDNPKRDLKAGRYNIEFKTTDYTSLCPKTGYPDYAEVKVNYIPAETCVETKSFKLYLVAFRMYGGFMEQVCNKIADDMVKVCDPYFLVVTMKFSSRGGIESDVQAVRGDPEAEYPISEQIDHQSES